MDEHGGLFVFSIQERDNMKLAYDLILQINADPVHASLDTHRLIW